MDGLLHAWDRTKKRLKGAKEKFKKNFMQGAAATGDTNPITSSPQFAGDTYNEDHSLAAGESSNKNARYCGFFS
jgi:hypothetical protein